MENNDGFMKMTCSNSNLYNVYVVYKNMPELGSIAEIDYRCSRFRN